MEDTRPRRGKERDLLDGALQVFAADGYTRASIDAIAAAADVSTRTIYNRFGDKASLFQAVIVDSARRVAEIQIAIIDKHLGSPDDDKPPKDIAKSLRTFARAWTSPDPALVRHFALVRQVRADVDHVPTAVIDAWQEAGPLRVRRKLAARLERIAAHDQLRIDDAQLAAGHLVQLIAGDIAIRSFDGARPLPRAETRRLADAGVAAFLRAYGRS